MRRAYLRSFVLFWNLLLRLNYSSVYLLVPLKHTLTDLTISTNPRIDNDAVPALMLLSKLAFLSILDTNITMTGLRQMANIVISEKRVVDIEIPLECEAYIDRTISYRSVGYFIHTDRLLEMDKKYAVDLPPPLASSPTACATMAVAALKRNLREHAQHNSAISAVGTRKEMADRLEMILIDRKKDLVVRDLLGPQDESDE